ncbi:hypothetical protein BN7_2731 [Wickerhamomyces ciferrii]|uniref:Zn(2)-C6 fungal-type domain-containing protein n=1 Tax=Wickerhamomyces ciferrii (strain ATCC 14091 / BCRC 22168 / CBS 111 / JCM 3599 / NBRC 0793 / NRRL Y-1031 F-60-10) TaxID=1206466 RepID=K0KP71_WICCF|nr:uncharacterized protein BN7_2731 [Wickerhamomyces ciferrii]CCH43184.1 hypothetical protein BN7_2731 [Wickerhamomyces ciferrii]
MPPKILSKDLNYISPLQQLQTKNQTGKRIRVSRACDTCRRRKVKCDGKQPCIHCTVYSYECSYNKAAPAPAQKRQKKESEAVGAGAGPGASTATASTAAKIANHEPTQSKSVKVEESNQTQIPKQSSVKPAQPTNSNTFQDQLIQTIFPQLDTQNENFNTDLFLQVLEKHKKNGVIDLNSILKEYNAIENPHIHGRSIAPIEIKIILPPREIALKLIYKTWNEACVLFRFYHRPSFINDFNSLYETNPNEYTNHQNKVLPLIYSVIAVGALFSKGDNAIDNQYLQDEGYKYFIASRKLIDITNSTDIQSIQTIFMLTLFLQCSARLSTCYSYIGIALRSALRQGLHRKLQTFANPIESEIKKRLFWTIYKLEIYVNSMLGLPNSINETDIDVEFPQDLDDVNIDQYGILPQQLGKLSSCGMNNSHTKLILILNHIVQKIYKTQDPIFVIPLETIRNLENELKIWIYELPNQLKQNSNTPLEYLKANKLLHLDYLHVKIMLYRPFIHYVKIAKHNKNSTSSCHLEKGLKCIEISKQIVYLAQEMINKKLLNGSYWFSIHTIFFAVACLVYYFLEVDSTDENIIQTIEMGKRILSVLKERSVSAQRIYTLLNSMFENYDRNNVHVEVLEPKNPTKSTTTTKTTPNITTNPNTFVSPSSMNDPATDPITSQLTSTNNQLLNPSDTAAIAPTNNQPLDQSHYVPGMMDDFDMKIFGRFLPSYMLQRPHGTSGPGTNGGDMPINEELENDPMGPINSLLGDNHPSVGSTVKTSEEEDEENMFDWVKFFDKNGDGNLGFDI